jgi:hypothetical protein
MPQQVGTMGGASIGASPMTSVVSLGLPRMAPWYTPNNIAYFPSRAAASASTFVMSWMP